MITSKDLKPNEKIATCEIHGEYKQRQILLVGTSIPNGECPKCASEKLKAHQQKRNAAVEAERQRIAVVHTDNFKKFTPLRFKHADFDNYVVSDKNQERRFSQCKTYADKFEVMHERGTGLILCGTPGTGKTHLAIAIGKQTAKKGFSTRYLTQFDLVRSIRATWSDCNASEDAIMKSLINLDLLIIDEIGSQTGTDNERSILFNIIDGRYQRILPTIILSNLSVDEMAEIISERSIDRITDGGGGSLVFNWSSYRQKRGAA